MEIRVKILERKMFSSGTNYKQILKTLNEHKNLI